MKTILVTGASGMLGEAIERTFTNYSLILTDKDELDVTKDKPNVHVDYILHLAAETNLELCESYPKHAYYTNTMGTMNMVEYAKKLDIPIIYISTAGVFNSPGTLNEMTEPNPINHYGRSKYYGEIAVKAYPKHYIFRQSWAFGGGIRDKKFVMKIVKQILDGKKELNAIDTTFGSPTYTMDTARLIHKALKEGKLYGTYHIPTGVATRYTVAKEIVKLLDMPVEVYRTLSYEPTSYFCPRPINEVLHSVKVMDCRDWKEALKEYINETIINQPKP